MEMLRHQDFQQSEKTEYSMMSIWLSVATLYDEKQKDEHNSNT